MVPITHPIVKQFEENENWEPSLDVHGGVTYTKKIEDQFSIGFDCAHAGDMCPGGYGLLMRGTYRNMEYVKKETEKLAEQLRKYEPNTIAEEDHPACLR